MRQLNLEEMFKTQINSEYHLGNKDTSSNGGKRLLLFCRWVFEEMADRGDIIVTGHSLWFRSFFKGFLPSTYTGNGKHKVIFDDCKVKKMVNAGVVSFDLQGIQNATDGWIYRIDPDSIEIIHGSFKKE